MDEGLGHTPLEVTGRGSGGYGVFEDESGVGDCRDCYRAEVWALNASYANAGFQKVGVFGALGSGEARLPEPEDAAVAVDEATGDVYVADRIDSRGRRDTIPRVIFLRHGAGASPTEKLNFSVVVPALKVKQNIQNILLVKTI